MNVVARCGVHALLVQLSAARKHSNEDLRWMQRCNNPVKSFGERCWRHTRTLAPVAVAETDSEGIGLCHLNGWHVNADSPCFETRELAAAYRQLLTDAGRHWLPQKP